MSCNGCRALRKGCGESCVLRPCLEWIDTAQSQANATLFLSKFFGRSDLMAFIAAVPPNKRLGLFQSLLFEACGRTVNPVNGAVGLLSTGNWHVCQAAVETVLAGGTLQPVRTGILPPGSDESSDALLRGGWKFENHFSESKTSVHGSDLPSSSHPFTSLTPLFTAYKGTSGQTDGLLRAAASFASDLSGLSVSFCSSDDGMKTTVRGSEEPKLLNLFP